MADNAQTRAAARRAGWTLEVVQSFEEAEAQTRAYWHAATPAERLNGLEALRSQLYGSDPTSQRLQRFLEVVSRP